VDNGSIVISQFDGAAEKGFTLTSSAFTLRDDDNLVGLVAYADYKSAGQSNPLWIPPWGAVGDTATNQLGGQALNSTITSPGAGQDGDVVTWDNGSSEWTTTNVVDAASSAGVMVVVFDTILFSNTSSTPVVPSIPEGSVVWDILVWIETPFDGSGTDLLDVGITADGDKYENNLDMSAAQGMYGLSNVADRVSAVTNITYQYFDSGADAANGEAYIYVKYSRIQ
jgi:hypothetical protein